MCFPSDYGTGAHMTVFIRGFTGQYMLNGQNLFIQAQMISTPSHTSVLNTPAQAPPSIQTVTLGLFFYLETSGMGPHTFVTTYSSQRQTLSLVLTKHSRQPATRLGCQPQTTSPIQHLDLAVAFP